MTIELVSPIVYTQAIKTPYHIFGSAAFNSLNASKVEEVYYLLFKDTKVRLGLIAGRKEALLVSPFSAPFGGYSFVHADVRIKMIEDAVSATELWCRENGLNRIVMTLPPPIYNEGFLAKLSNVFFRKQYEISTMEVNFHFDLTRFSESYIDNIWHNARKNLRIALSSELSFEECLTWDAKEIAYEIIRKNREAKGKPLRMSWDQVRMTVDLISSDFFIVKKEGIPIASAIVFRVTNEIVQVIYWGDLENFQQLKTMNFLSYKVFEFYKAKQFRYVDIGYSTENSVPNYGLCEFKESLGCDMQPKITFSKQL